MASTTSPGNVRWALAEVGPGPASQLQKALKVTPANAEVIASVAIMGGFSARSSIYILRAGETVKVQSHEIVFVLDPARDNGVVTAADSTAISAFIRNKLRSRLLVGADGVTVFMWHPPPGTSHLTIPSARPPVTNP